MLNPFHLLQPHCAVSIICVFLYLSNLFSPPHSSSEERTQVRGPRKSPAVGSCRFYEGSPPGDLLQKKQVSLKGKVETPSSAMHAAFLSYKALKYTNTTTNPTVHPLGLLKPKCHEDNHLQLLSV